MNDSVKWSVTRINAWATAFHDFKLNRLLDLSEISKYADDTKLCRAMGDGKEAVVNKQALCP